MSSLTRNEILACSDTGRRTVSVPEWGGHVEVRILSGAEMDAVFAAHAKDETPIGDVLLVECVVDDEGKRLFTAADLPALKAKSFAALKRVRDAAARLNGYGLEAEQDAEKN